MSLSTSIFCFFFFSSRRRHTRLQGDWSSDVCSSDLLLTQLLGAADVIFEIGITAIDDDVPRFHTLSESLNRLLGGTASRHHEPSDARSEERRVGKECRSRWSPYH